MKLEQSVARHYTHGSLEPAILEALTASGKDFDRLSEAETALRGRRVKPVAGAQRA